MTTQQPTKRPIRRGRIFPEYTIPPEELARSEAERKARYQRTRPVFERWRDELIADHYNWFMIIEPNSGDYFIDPDENLAVEKARQKYPSDWLVTFRINDTGACGMI
ncbi:hypothetical protein [Argonema galeatum]|uniref:hypothetical protein n=1 Tax=Argonema galeatum TaxID=2942762 RepID=UPI0020139A8D|nr:hypothetical protein [Argonema galeatum]MCL1468408.1 hypothetical protein [Argonema galeatum A003/A1]